MLISLVCILLTLTTAYSTRPPSKRQLLPFPRMSSVSIDMIDDVMGPIIHMEIGSIKSRLTVLLDTGSTILWVPGDPCLRPQESAQYFHQFPQFASMSFRLLDAQKKVEYNYADGCNVECSMVQDHIKLGSSFFVPDSTFCLAYTVTKIDKKFDGTLGLAHISSGDHQIVQPFFKWISQFNTRQITFNYDTSIAWTNAQGMKTGQFIMGDVNPQIMNGPMTWMNIVPHTSVDPSFPGVWSLMLSRITMDDFAVPIQKPIPIDTGSNYNVIPLDLYNAILRKLNLPQQPSQHTKVILPCSSIPQISLAFTFEGGIVPTIGVSPVTFTVRGQNLFFKYDESQCLLAYTPGDLFILGTGFIRQFVTTFNYDTKQIGFAHKF